MSDRQDHAGSKTTNDFGPAKLTPEEQRALLRIARAAIEDAVLRNREEPTVELANLSPSLREPGAAFVTLTKHGELRGCIGCIEPEEALALCVARHAVYAATGDPRFSSVTADELPRLHIEVNVLRPPQKVRGIEDFLLGKHGLILEKEGCRGLFLPEVMTEEHWTAEETLSHLCLKAGLPRAAWKSGYTLYCFETQAFGEEKRGA
ncbi:MAG: AmmeMemoRadiSam system protein A [Verrucomicrobia bacterium]|nr:AmmeMemoRadiSam system protein A [Verrucomicrobiota bacterium]